MLSFSLNYRKMFNFFFKLRLKAITNVASILDSNPFSGPYSLNQIEKARKNREMNQGWFLRDYDKIKRKLSNDDFEKLKKKLDL